MRAPRHPTVLIDLDHTLLDSATSEARAFDHTMAVAGVADPDRHREVYGEINGRMWAAVERGEMAPGDVRLARFREFVATTKIDADPQMMADEYAGGLQRFGELFPGAHEALDRISVASSLALITNGVSDIQRARIDRLRIGSYFAAIVISSEVGVAKPGAGIFDLAFEQLGGPPRDGAVMVGDSLTSDIRGAIDYGLATCWFNPSGASTEVDVTYEIASLDQLPPVVLG